MYGPGGFHGSELGDIEVVPAGDALHLFHLTLPNHDVVGHAVSADGLAWRAVEPALHTGPPGAPDDDMIWTMGVASRGGVHHMLYTALARADGGRVQRVALATSRDLHRWTKHGVVAEADPRWYEVDRSTAPWVAFRDPKPFRAAGRFYATVCARDRAGPPARRGAVGLIASDDLRAWTVEPPLLAPRRWYELECPQAFRVGERWYLTACVMEDRSQRLWVGDDPRGPWRSPPDDRLAPPGHYAARVTCWRGLDVLFATHGAPAEARLPSPLVLAPGADGGLICRSWPAWADYAAGPAADPGPARPRHGLAGAFVDGPNHVAPGGLELWTFAEPAADFTLSGRLALEGRAGGLAFGLDEAAGGWFVELHPAERRARVVRAGAAPDARGRPWFAHGVIREAPWDPPAGPVPFALRVVADELELSVGDRVVLVARVEPPVRGHLGVFADGGRLEVADLRVTPMRAPVHG